MHSVQLMLARQLECDISPRVCLSASSLLIALFSPSSELSAASSAAAQGSEANAEKKKKKHERSRCGISVKSRDVPPGSGPSSGWGRFIEASCRSFQAFVRSRRPRRCATVSHRNGVTLCCSGASASAAQTAGTPRCRGQRSEIRAAAAASGAAEITPSPFCVKCEKKQPRFPAANNFVAPVLARQG